MTDDTHVDGNALGGLLFDLFGREMTDRSGCCGNCGAVSQFGSVLVYMQGPGEVLRCPSCFEVLVVITRIESTMRVNFGGLRWVEPFDV